MRVSSRYVDKATVNLMINAQNEKGLTALMLAATNGSYKMVMHLLEAGADASLVSAAGLNAFQYASMSSSNAMTSLGDHQPNFWNQIDVPVIDGLTPIQFACKSGASQLVDFLLQKGADPNRRTAEGTAILQECGSKCSR